MFTGPPFHYDYLNSVDGLINPSTIHVSDTALAHYFHKYLLQKAISRFKFTLPDTWDYNFFLYVLFCYGVLCVFNTDKFGVICQACDLSGYDVFYRPTKAVVSNPLINGKEVDIGYSCELFYLMPGYCGIMDIVTYYGDMMALASQTAGFNLLNSKLSYIFAAQNRSTAESFKAMADKVLSGEPAIVVDKKLFNDETGNLNMQLFAQNLKNNFITPELLSVLRDLELKFDTEIGIPNQNENLRERQNVDQVNMNNFETQCKVLLWLENMKRCCDKVNDMFDIGIKVELRNLNEGGMTDGIETFNHGAVSV